ncbi:hypothetical protein GCM10007962_24830 [Yeosuana aromativorans]|uniref:Cytochrome C n=1 Tax=Yeosuana aromativorans TaxID=288019 RepID=A0A8J3FKQ3_9FLAO|nr:cytochrome C [Yeosuana aromativorans]GGK29625.1 hypothetical protein GCM10007962_24830 [Yeosuana aromativorans]
MKAKLTRVKTIPLIGFLFALFFLPVNLFAVPSYARQTGLACSACHTVFPQLTAFGRAFKLNGYTLTGIKTISEELSSKDEKDIRQYLRVLGISPMSGMFQTGYTSLNKTMPDTQNNNLEFPQQLSLFYAGQVTPNIGTFIQLTLDNESGTIGLDNTDIRYANQTSGKIPITYGFTLNNNPTVQDLWNTTPAWGYPYTSSGVAPTPDASPMIENLGGSVAGLGAYAMVNNMFYFELSGYKTAQLGAALPPDSSVFGALSGTSPYWRAAIQKQFGKNYLSVGTFGLATKIYPDGIADNTDNYTDVAFDMQYERQFTNGQFTLHTAYTHENQKLNATYDAGNSEYLNNNLKKFDIDGSIYLKQGINFTAGYFNTSGSSDNGLFSAEAVSGNNSETPDNSGIKTQIDYLPWENTKLSLQYFAYNKFNGASNNYDGFGRNASDNNMLYLQLWFAF